MKQSILLILAVMAAAPTTTAFLATSPPQTQRSTASSTLLSARKKKSSAPKPNPACPPGEAYENFDDLDMVKLLGLRRLKKKARVHKRVLNQKIREGKVEQNTEGEWVPRQN